jgi:hypothetical protein
MREKNANMFSLMLDLKYENICSLYWFIAHKQGMTIVEK